MNGACNREAVERQWLARTLEDYPAATSRFLAGDKDRFRNPAGYALREGLPALLDYVLDVRERARALAALDLLIRMRAVQDFDAARAVGFVSALKDVLGECCAPAIRERIDELSQAARDLFAGCRRKLDEIRAAEARRRTYVLNRIGEVR